MSRGVFRKRLAGLGNASHLHQPYRQARANRAPTQGTFQSSPSHHDTACISQPPCGLGERFPQTLTVTAMRTCSNCPPDTYQASPSHRDVNCTDQPTCGPGQRYIASATSVRVCSPCTLGTYQPAQTRRETVCLPQTTCGPGQRLAGSSAVTDGTCEQCANNTYQSAAYHRFTACIVPTDPTCSQGVGVFTIDQGCVCPTGFSGSACQYSNDVTCNGLGMATENGTCMCAFGAVGVNCECVVASSNEGIGSCAAYASGYHSSTPYLHNCVRCAANGNRNPRTGTCVCSVRWTGDRCECFAPGIVATAMNLSPAVCTRCDSAYNLVNGSCNLILSASSGQGSADDADQTVIIISIVVPICTIVLAITLFKFRTTSSVVTTVATFASGSIATCTL